MANPLWKAGMKAVNPAGRPKASIRTVKGMVQNFVLRNVTPNKLQKMFNTLTEKQKIEMLLEFMPYVCQRQGSIDNMSAADVDKIYSELMEAIKLKDAI